MFDDFIFGYNEQQPLVVITVSIRSRLSGQLNDIAFLYARPVRLIQYNAGRILRVVNPCGQHLPIPHFQWRGDGLWYSYRFEERLDSI